MLVISCTFASCFSENDIMEEKYFSDDSLVNLSKSEAAFNKDLYERASKLSLLDNKEDREKIVCLINEIIYRLKDYYDTTGINSVFHKKLISRLLIGYSNAYHYEDLNMIVERVYSMDMIEQDAFECLKRMIGAAMSIEMYHDLTFTKNNE